MSDDTAHRAFYFLIDSDLHSTLQQLEDKIWKAYREGARYRYRYFRGCYRHMYLFRPCLVFKV